MTPLAPGTILGGRFALVGALGSGGTATVYLAVDQLRGERVALKLVHPHLARDPGVRRRLQREVAAAGVLRHEAALVPWDLHELDGHLGLSLPYHAGQTLSEYVAATGPLPIPAARELGVRLAGALAAAHRAGLLHRDVTGNNVLVEGGRSAVLTDFGLSRAQADATQSTGLLGTAGYAAPEVYAGTRADPRADLYGLGCVLYLAVTGRAPFGTGAPMAVLQRQLAEEITPISALRPDCPPNLAATILSLLRKDPAARPPGARDVLDALVAQRPVDAPARDTGPPRAHLEPGRFAVVVREKPGDEGRRQQLRTERRRARAPRSTGDDLRRALEHTLSTRAQEIVGGVLAFAGIERPPGQAEPPLGPEDLLAHAVAAHGGVSTDAIRQPLALLEKRFVLAHGVSERIAQQLREDAIAAGFRAEVAPLDQPPANALRPAIAFGLLAAGWVGVAVVARIDPRLTLLYIAFMVFYSVLAPALAGGRKRLASVDGLPIAYRPQLDRELARPIPGRYPLADAVPVAAPPEPAPASRSAALLLRATGQIDALTQTVAELGLPTAAASDLRSTARDLRERATELADAIERIERELSAEPEDRSWVAPRLHRLQTKQRAGEPVDPAELSRLQAALDAHAEAEAASARLESQLTTATAGLLEIASTAARVRRELLDEPHSAAPDALGRLRDEARNADRARRELRAAERG